MDSQKTENFDTIVVGAGQAGLAMGYYLAQQGTNFVILEGERGVGLSWANRWDSLRLFTPAKVSHLPGMPFPAPPDSFPTKDETVQYLERYTEKFHLPVLFNTPVDRLYKDEGVYFLNAGERQFTAKQVVVATGTFQKPNIPKFAAALNRDICQLHSSAYRNPAQLRDGNVLVVGAGNSGAEIATELANGRRQVWLSGRDTGRIPIPRKIPGGDQVYWWLINKKLTADTKVGRKVRAKMLASGGDPLIGISMKQVAQAGVHRIGRTVGVRDGKPVTEEGQALDISNLIWATGFIPDYHWIELPIFTDAGLPRHIRGVINQEPGIYFLGLRFMYTISSPLLGGVGADASYLAGIIAEKSVGYRETSKRDVQLQTKAESIL